VVGKKEGGKSQRKSSNLATLFKFSKIHTGGTKGNLSGEMQEKQAKVSGILHNTRNSERGMKEKRGGKWCYNK